MTYGRVKFDQAFVLDDVNVVTEIISGAGNHLAATIEQRIKLVLKPAPKWIPEKVWHRMAVKFLEIQFYPMTSQQGKPSQ